MDRPSLDEYPEFYQTYVSAVPDEPVFDLLRSQRQVFSSLVRSLSNGDADHRYEPGKWSVKEVVGHVIDVERIFATRGLAIARKDGASYPGFDENEYVAAADFSDRSITSLDEEFSGIRTATLALFENMAPDVATRRGDANGASFTVRALVYIMAGHQRHHDHVLRTRYGVGGRA